MTWQETGYGGYCALGVEWNESNASATTYTIAPTVWRWDYYSVNVSSQQFWEALYPEPNGSTGGWTGLNFSNGSGWRKVDTFATRTYTKDTTSKTITLDVGTNAYFASINDGGFYSIGEKMARFTITIPAKTSYTISYNANGGSNAPANQKKWHGDNNFTLSTQVPTRTGYTFNGWNTKSDGSGTNYAKGASYTGNANLTLYAKWTINTWTVSYNGNGSTSGSTSSQTKTYGQTLTLRANGYTRTNYVFKNWNTAANGSGTSYNASGSYTANAAATMYAQWYAPYTITPNANGGTLASGCSALTKVYNSPKAIWASSLNPTRSGYNFTGWNTNSAGTGTAYAAGASYTANANATLYAQWAIAHSNPTISNLSVKRCDSSGTLADDGDHCKVTATVTVDYSTTGYTDTKVNTVTVKLGSNSAETVYSKGSDTGVTSYSVSFVSANTASITSAYTVTLTVTDTKNFSASKSATLSVAFFTMHFKEGGKGIAIGKKSVTNNLFDVNMPTTITGNTNITGTLTSTGKITSSANVQAQTYLILKASTDEYSGIRVLANSSSGRSADPIKFYGSSANADGDEIVVCNGGKVIIGAGESGNSLHNALTDGVGAEHLYLCGDGGVYIYSQCNTIANRSQWLLGNNSYAGTYTRCGANNGVTIGTSSNNGVTENTTIGYHGLQDKAGTWGGAIGCRTDSGSDSKNSIVFYMGAQNCKTDGTKVTNYINLIVDKNGDRRYSCSSNPAFRTSFWVADRGWTSLGSCKFNQNSSGTTKVTYDLTNYNEVLFVAKCTTANDHSTNLYGGSLLLPKAILNTTTCEYLLTGGSTDGGTTGCRYFSVQATTTQARGIAAYADSTNRYSTSTLYVYAR